jgi:hypothetical protein
MKIDTDLRLAIRSAYNAQHKDTTRIPEWRASHDAAEAFLKSPRGRSIRQKTDRLGAQIQKLRVAQIALFKSAGLSSCGDRIDDKAAFKKAGGSVPPDGPALWKFDAVMAEIAAATPEAGQAIIKRLGINWK